MERRTFITTLGAGLTVGVAGCLDAGGAPTEENTVGMTMNSFRPETLTVTPGTTVTFDNTSSHTHTVTAFQDAYPEAETYWSSGTFETEQQARDAWTSGGNGGLEPGESFDYTFEYEGTYAYFCIPHYLPDQGMTMEGTISVEPEP